MKFKPMQKAGALAVAVCLAFSAMPVFAADTDKIEVILTDVTETDLTTLSGEAKIKVSVKGAEGSAGIAQISLGFTGDLKYKSIQFLQGENNPPDCFLYSPNTALANSKKELMPSIISSKALTFNNETDLFILTFAGEAGDSVTLNLDDLDNTYCTVGGIDLKAGENKSITVTASAKENSGKQAVVKLVMDKVDDFTAGKTEDGYMGSGVELKITSEKTNGYTVYTILNNTLVSKGGHRESESVPTFTVENTVLADDTYTVEISGIGYVPYKKTGVTFDEKLELTNADFMPGDINADGKVDKTDKEECEKAIADAEYAKELEGAADFNRDGVVDKYDLKVFSGISDDKNIPSKMSKPTVTGGSEKITVKWTKPEDDNITGYTIQYGTTGANLSKTKEIANADTTSIDITGLSKNTTYYVRIAAKNADGTGDYSDIVSAKTDSGGTNEGGAGGGGGGASSGGSIGGGSIGGGSVSGGSIGGGSIGDGGASSAVPGKSEAFTDLDNHAWAKESIYKLKDKGIISGVSETEFAPANNIKRGDFILILTRMLGIDNAFDENFADVPQNSYYYEAIGKAKAAGIASGDGENFMPEASITRQDLITLAYRAFLAKGYIEEIEDYTVLDAFRDKDIISDYAAAPMASMVKAGIIQGSDGSVNPKGNATRAEVAVMCARLLELMK